MLNTLALPTHTTTTDSRWCAKKVLAIAVCVFVCLCSECMNSEKTVDLFGPGLCKRTCRDYARVCLLWAKHRRRRSYIGDVCILLATSCVNVCACLCVWLCVAALVNGSNIHRQQTTTTCNRQREPILVRTKAHVRRNAIEESKTTQQHPVHNINQYF